MNQPLWVIEGTMAKAARDAVIAALEASDYHLTAAAQRLRVGRSTLYRLIENYQIPIPDAEPGDAARKRSRQGRPVRTKLPGAAHRDGGTAKEGPRIVHVDGAWYLLDSTAPPTTQA